MEIYKYDEFLYIMSDWTTFLSQKWKLSVCNIREKQINVMVQINIHIMYIISGPAQNNMSADICTTPSASNEPGVHPVRSALAYHHIYRFLL